MEDDEQPVILPVHVVTATPSTIRAALRESHEALRYQQELHSPQNPSKHINW